MEKWYEKKIRFAVYGMILLIMICNLIFWGSRKEGFFCDELYSYHFVCQTSYPSVNGARGDVTFTDHWHTPEYFMDYFTITKEEAFDLSGTLKSISYDVHPPLYYLLLELVCSVAAFVMPGVFSKWFGISVNLIFFVLTIIVLFLLAKRLLKSEPWGAAVCILYGLSVGAASTVVFLRMYTIFTFVCVLFTYLNLLLWESLWKEKGKRDTGLYIALALTAVMGVLNHYYFFIYAFFSCVMIWGYALIRRKFLFAVKYAAAMAAGILGSLLLWPAMLTDIFSDYRGAEAFGNLKENSDWGGALKEFVSLINSRLFGGNVGMGLLIILFVVLTALCAIEFYWQTEKVRSQEGIRFVLCKKEKREKLSFSLNIHDLFFLQVLIVIFLYVALIAKIAPYREARYLFNLFPVVVLTIVYLAEKITSALKQKKQWMRVLAVVLFVLMLAGYIAPGVDYLYKGTDYEMMIAENHSHLPTFYVSYSNVRYQVCGDSVYLSKAQHLYPTTKEGIDSLSAALEELSMEDATQFVVYIDKTFSDTASVLEEVKEELGAANATHLFNTEYSEAYVLECD